jgi:hypothetical protein
MDKLPSELISIVARDVVTDMSFPICHLREVSRSFRDIFSPYQYLLVVIRGLWKIEILVKGMLACSSDTLRTEHLYVSDRASARTIRGEPPKKPSIFSRVAKGVRKLGAQPTDYGHHVPLLAIHSGHAHSLLWRDIPPTASLDMASPSVPPTEDSLCMLLQSGTGPHPKHTIRRDTEHQGDANLRGARLLSCKPST